MTTIAKIKQRRYKAKIDQVAPTYLRNQLITQNTAMLGLSLGSKNSESTRLKASLDFIIEHFNHGAVVVGDGLYHLTLQLTQGLTPSIAKREAAMEGHRLMQRNRKILEPFISHHGVEVIYLSQVREHDKFPIYLKSMYDFFEHSTSFQQEVEQFAHYYLQRITQQIGDQAHIRNQALTIATRYLLEECALFACLKTEGWNSFVYGGSLATFEHIAAGQFPDIIDPLKTLSFVGLKFEKRGWIEIDEDHYAQAV